MEERSFSTVCPRDCYDSCFLRVTTNNGKITSVRGDPTNPVTRGITCLRAAKDSERVTRNRVFYPYIRTDSTQEKFKRSNWDHALTLITDTLRHTLAEFGPEAVLHLEYAGNTGLLTWYYPQRLWNALGAIGTDSALCSQSGNEALSLHYGSSYGLQPEELPKQKLIVWWGFNAAVSSIHLWALSRKAKNAGAVIAVIDPRQSKSARKADIWLNPLPGSDVALAFGIARYLIINNYVNLNFIEKWTSGYELLKEEIMKWTPNRVKKATGLAWNRVEELASAYAELTPSATMLGIGFQKNRHGAELVRAAALLPAFLGYHRGFFYSNGNAYPVDVPLITGGKLAENKPKTVNQVGLSRYVQQGDFKFIFIYNMNPALTLPNQNAFREGLSRNDVFVVVHETHWTETTEYADMVLPAPTYLEKDDLIIPWSHPYVRMATKVIKPLGENKDEIWVMQELAKRLGLSDDWLFEDPWRAIEKALEGAFEQGIFDDIIKGEVAKLTRKPLNQYPTSTEKIEFYSTNAEELGLDPIPRHWPLEPTENELILLNSGLSKYTHTQFREVYGPIPPIVRLNPDDANQFGIKEGETVTLKNTQGSVSVRAEISLRQPKGILWSPKLLVGLGEEPQNKLTAAIPQQIGKGSVFNSTIVRISRKLE